MGALKRRYGAESFLLEGRQAEVLGAEFYAGERAEISFDGFEDIELWAEISGMVAGAN